MDTKQAIKILEEQISEISILKRYRPFTKEHIKWVSDTLLFLEDIFGKNSQFYQGFRELDYEHEGQFEYVKGNYQATVRWLNQIAYQRDLDIAQGLLESGIDLLKRKGIDSVYEGKDTPKEASEIVKIVFLIENKLRKVIRDKPTKEAEIQDALEGLFIGADLDGEFTREKEHILYSSKTYKPDFVFNRIGTVVEIKFCDKMGRDKEIIGQINDDILAYRTKYPNLIFVVYDVGVIRNIDEFKESFEQQKSVIVKIIKH